MKQGYERLGPRCSSAEVISLASSQPWLIPSLVRSHTLLKFHNITMSHVRFIHPCLFYGRVCCCTVRRSFFLVLALVPAFVLVLVRGIVLGIVRGIVLGIVRVLNLALVLAIQYFFPSPALPEQTCGKWSTSTSALLLLPRAVDNAHPPCRDDDLICLAWHRCSVKIKTSR